MKLSKEQKDQAISKISHPYGSVELICDGYFVTLQVQRFKAMSYRVMTYVNGVFEGLWMNEKNEAPEQKFLRKSVRPVYSAKFKSDMEKIMGKRRVAKDPRYSKTMTFYFPDWASGKAAINHLCKVCDSVQVVDPKETATQEAP